MKRSFTIFEEVLPKLEAKVASVRKKLTKFNTDILYYTHSTPRFVTDPLSPFYKQFVVDVEIEGNYRINEWDFVAVCNYDTSVHKNIVKTTPNNIHTIPEIYYTANHCDHCHTNRERKTTILLYNNKTDEWKQVGSSCVKDYIGVDATNYLNYLNCIDSLEDYEFMKPSTMEHYFAVKDIIIQTIARASETGYISQRKAQEVAENQEKFISTTASDVFHIMNRSVDASGKRLISTYEITENLVEKANSVISFINSLNDLNNEYIHNLKTLIEMKYVTNKNLGLVVSMVGYYLRETAKNEKQESVPSQYVGEIGSTLQFEGIPQCIYSYETDYGVSYIYKFLVDNNVVIWKTGKVLDNDSAIMLKGRVKAQQEYRGEKQTEVTRCRIIV